jgi:hypothetical protein
MAGTLIRKLAAAPLALGIVLGGIGVENRVVKILEQIPVPGVPAALERRDHGAAAGAPILRVVGVGQNAELFDRVQVRRKLPFSSEAHRRAVQQELVGSFLAAVDDELAVRIPAAQSRESRRAELFLREDHSWAQAHQRVRLTADQRQRRQFRRIGARHMRRAGHVQAFALRAYGHVIRHLADLQNEWQHQRIVGVELQVGALQRLEPLGVNLDAIRPRGQKGATVISGHIRNLDSRLVVFDACDAQDRSGNRGVRGIGDLPEHARAR